MPNALSKLAQEMTHYGTGRIPTQQEVDDAIDVGMGRKPRDIVYGEQGLQAPSVAGGMVSLDPTDYLGPAELKALLGVAGKGLPMAMAGIMAGKGAKTANLVMLDKAQEMAKAGIPHDQIWKETGWALDTPDKLPRFEIPDNAAMYRGTYPAASAYADKAMHHPELFKAYPDAGEIRFESNIPNIGGEYLPNGKEEIVRLGANEGTNTGSMALHELQHAIQQREGFASGGNPSAFPNIDEQKQMLSDANVLSRIFHSKNGDIDLAKEQFRKFMGREPALGAESTVLSGLNADEILRQKNLLLSPEEKYQRLAGEAEARLTQSRMNMTPAERLAQYPYDPAYFEKATGVPLNSLIVMKDSGPAMSIPNKSMADLISEAQAQIDAENAARNMLHYQPENNRVRNALIGIGAGGAGLAGGYYGTDYLSR